MGERAIKDSGGSWKARQDFAREKAKIGSLDGGCRRSASHSIAAECGALNRRDANKKYSTGAGLSSIAWRG